MPVRGLENHSLNSRWDWKTWGIKKCIKDHSSMRLFCKGVPVRSRRLWLQRGKWNGEEDGQQNILQVSHLPSIPPFRTGLLSHKSRTSPSSPVEIEQWLPALWLEVLYVLSLIQYKITPVLAAEGLVVLQHQLVRCDTHMEGIGLGPALQYREKAAESRVKRTNKKKTS